MLAGDPGPGSQQTGGKIGFMCIGKLGSVFLGSQAFYSRVRHRPSHLATGWRSHWNNGPIDNRVPMPFGRGVPMRADAIGDSIPYLDTIQG